MHNHRSVSICTSSFQHMSAVLLCVSPTRRPECWPTCRPVHVQRFCMGPKTTVHVPSCNGGFMSSHRPPHPHALVCSRLDRSALCLFPAPERLAVAVTVGKGLGKLLSFRRIVGKCSILGRFLLDFLPPLRLTPPLPPYDLRQVPAFGACVFAVAADPFVTVAVRHACTDTRRRPCLGGDGRSSRSGSGSGLSGHPGAQHGPLCSAAARSSQAGRACPGPVWLLYVHSPSGRASGMEPPRGLRRCVRRDTLLPPRRCLPGPHAAQDAASSGPRA